MPRSGGARARSAPRVARRLARAAEFFAAHNSWSGVIFKENAVRGKRVVRAHTLDFVFDE